MLINNDGMLKPGESFTRLVNYLDKLHLDVSVSYVPGLEPRRGSFHSTQGYEQPASDGLDIEILVPNIIDVRPPAPNLAKHPTAEQAIWDTVRLQLELSDCMLTRVADLWFGPQGNLSLVGVILQESRTARHRPDEQGSMVGLILLLDKPSAELRVEADYLAQKEDLGIYYISKSSGTCVPIKSIRRKKSCQSLRRLQLEPKKAR